MKNHQRDTKKKIRELKRIRTAILVGERVGNVDEINEEIEKLRKSIPSPKVVKAALPVKKITVNEEEKTVKVKLTLEKYLQLHGEGKTPKEIATIVGMPVGSVYTVKSEWKKKGLLPSEPAKETKPSIKNNTETLPPVKSNDLEIAMARIVELEREVAQLRMVKDVAKPLLKEWVANL